MSGARGHSTRSFTRLCSVSYESSRGQPLGELEFSKLAVEVRVQVDALRRVVTAAVKEQDDETPSWEATGHFIKQPLQRSTLRLHFCL